MKLSFSFALILWATLAVAGEAPKPPAPAAPATPAVTPPKAGAPAGGKTAAPAAPKVEDAADKAPVKILDDGGIQFSPSIAKNVRRYLTKPAVDKHIVLFVGPGVNGPEKGKIIPASGNGWTCKAGPESVTKASVTGLELMEELPAVLASSKAGIVVLVGVAGRPKMLPTDKQDWGDAATLCLRYGAIPVAAIPAASSDDDPLRWALRGACSTANCPAVDARVEAVADRIQPLLKLIETHIYGASPIGKNAEPVDE